VKGAAPGSELTPWQPPLGALYNGAWEILGPSAEEHDVQDRADEFAAVMAVETALEGLSRPLERQDALDDRSNHARIDQASDLDQLATARLHDERDAADPVGGGLPPRSRAIVAGPSRQPVFRSRPSTLQG